MNFGLAQNKLSIYAVCGGCAAAVVVAIARDDSSSPIASYPATNAKILNLFLHETLCVNEPAERNVTLGK